jgi:hypothetical protein
LHQEPLRHLQPLQVIRLQHLRYLAVHLIQPAISGFVCFIEAIFHGHGYCNVPAPRACGVHVLDSGDGVATNEGCEQEQPGADKSDHGCTIPEPSVGLFCTEREKTWRVKYVAVIARVSNGHVLVAPPISPG